MCRYVICEQWGLQAPLGATAEFEKKDGVLSGTAPFLFESAEVTRILHQKATGRATDLPKE